MRVSKSRQNFHFWVSYPFKLFKIWGNLSIVAIEIMQKLYSKNEFLTEIKQF